jgi:hypothetical protein
MCSIRAGAACGICGDGLPGPAVVQRRGLGAAGFLHDSHLTLACSKTSPMTLQSSFHVMNESLWRGKLSTMG